MHTIIYTEQIDRMAMQSKSRFISLPPELLEKIFIKISDPKDIIRVLAVNRQFTACAKISFNNIRTMDIHCNASDIFVVNGTPVGGTSLPL